MKNLIFPIFAALLFAACQNPSTTTPPAAQEQATEQVQAPAPVETKPVTKLDVLQSIAKSKTLMEDATGFAKDLAALPAATKTANKDMYETLTKYAAGILENQPKNAAAMEAAAAQGDNINQEEMRKIIMATDEYARHMDGFRSRIQSLQNGGPNR